jgi:hypothetical protein
LVRDVDVTGVSGEGCVVWGIQFPDGYVAYRWNTATSTTCLALSIDDVRGSWLAAPPLWTPVSGWRSWRPVAVLLPDRRLGVRRRNVTTADTHGDHYGAGWAGMVGPWPGRAVEGDDVPYGQDGGRAWLLAVDTAGWPVQQGDLVVDPGNALEWLVTSARLIRNNYSPDVDYVRVEAHQKVSSETRP